MIGRQNHISTGRVPSLALHLPAVLPRAFSSQRIAAHTRTRQFAAPHAADIRRGVFFCFWDWALRSWRSCKSMRPMPLSFFR